MYVCKHKRGRISLNTKPSCNLLSLFSMHLPGHENNFGKFPFAFKWQIPRTFETVILEWNAKLNDMITAVTFESLVYISQRLAWIRLKIYSNVSPYPEMTRQLNIHTSLRILELCDPWCSIVDQIHNPTLQRSHISKCTSPISHNAPFCSSNVHICVRKLCGIFV